MDRNLLLKQELVAKDSHFMPLVFVDLSVPTAAVGAACTYAGRSINQELKDGKKKITNLRPDFEKCLVPIGLSTNTKNELLKSISDITL